MSLDFGKLNFSVSFNPTSAFPLDARSYFESYESAVAAAATAMPAGDSTTTYYYGENICVVEDNVATLYIIQPNKTLSKVGGEIKIDANQFALDSGGALNLLGFADAVAGAQLVKSAEGKLQWVKPDTSTVEGLATEVAALRSDVTTLQGNIKNVYTKAETDSAISSAIAGASHLKRQIVESLPEVAEADANTIYMVPKTSGSGQNIYDEYMVINGEWEILGNTDVDLTQYVTETKLGTELDKKVDKEEGSRLITSAEVTKLQGIEAEAEKNIIDSVTGEFSISDQRELSITAIAQSKVTGLSEALDNKVSVELGKGLSANDFTDNLKGKLDGIETGAQANLIEVIKIGEEPLQISEKAVALPTATALALGLVKGSSEDNGISVKSDGSMEVNNITLSKIKQLENETLVINGGTSVI